jgi:8-oxo-dGTP pyrophosphatase MutT (NUDIX family)
MPVQPSFVTDAKGKRQFGCASVAVQGIIVNEAEQVLLLSHPERKGVWEVVSGAWEAGETLLQGVLREVGEEAGSSVRVRPLGTVHAQSFHYDATVRYMIGDDMLGSRYRWWTLEELMDPSCKISVPQKWILKRAVELYHLWVDCEVELQPDLDSLP